MNISVSGVNPINNQTVTRAQPPHPLVRLLIVIALLTCLAVIYDRVSVVLNSELVPAKIVGCGGKWVKFRVGNSGSTYRNQVQYMPAAVTATGDEAIGVIMLPSRSLCAQMVGKEVGMFVHPTDPEQNRIHSFVQFWAISLLVLFFPIAFWVGIKLPARGWLFSSAFLVAFSGAALWELGVLERYFPRLMTGEDVTPSTAALRRCVWAAMAEQKVSERRDVKKLLCMDEGIDDLTSIADLVFLEKLYLQGNALTSLEGLANFTRLKTLSVAGNKSLTSTRGIEHLVLLEEFQANKSAISDLSGVEQLTELRIVGLMMNDISDVSAFANLTNLEDVVFNYNRITDISAFANKPHLKKVQLYSNLVSDVSPLFGNKALTLIGVNGAGKISCEQINELRTHFPPDAKIYGPTACN